MIPEILRYKIPTDQTGEFEAAYTRAGEQLQQSEHCHGYELLRSQKDPELYLLTIVWDSAEGHLEGFRKSPVFMSFLKEIRPYIPMIEEMEHYEYTPLAWKRDA